MLQALAADVLLQIFKCKMQALEKCSGCEEFSHCFFMLSETNGRDNEHENLIYVFAYFAACLILRQATAGDFVMGRISSLLSFIVTLSS